jgi:hypothetical protein
MYYLLKPDASVWWVDLPTSVVKNLVSKHPDAVGNMQNLDWKRAERPFDAGLLNIALRKGIASPGGLIVAAVDLAPLDYYRQMVDILEREWPRDSTNVPHADVMESQLPGWEEETRQLDDGVEASQVQTVERAKQGLVHALYAPVLADLAEHWQNLGGGLPPAVTSRRERR